MSDRRPLIQMCPVPQESQPLEAHEQYEAPIPAEEENADHTDSDADMGAPAIEVEAEDADCAKEESVAVNAGGHMSQNGLNSLDRFSPENTHSVRQNMEEMSNVLPLPAKRRSIVTSDKYEQNDQPALINNHLLSRKSDDAPPAKE